MTLIERLLELSRMWCAAHDRSLSRLATIVANDGKLLARLEEGKGCTVAMVERFLTFFRNPANWPDAVIPADAAPRLQQLAVLAVAEGGDIVSIPPDTSGGGGASSGKAAGVTSTAEAA